jgi:hypothetical protein
MTSDSVDEEYIKDSYYTIREVIKKALAESFPTSVKVDRVDEETSIFTVDYDYIANTMIKFFEERNFVIFYP